jgi:hypothetical protein
MSKDQAATRCVECGTQVSTGPLCYVCVREVLDAADRERIPLVGAAKPAARRIGFRPPEGERR